MEYHVSIKGSDKAKGTLKDPFRTINKAAQVAIAGDEITVHEGVYREWVDPQFKGLSDKRRVVYQAAKGEKVVIKGSERIQNWVKVEGSVWKVVIPNLFFGDYNPYAFEVFGDWLVTIEDTKHLGDVYLNSMSFYEVSTYDELLDPKTRNEVTDHWTKNVVPIRNVEQTKYVWYAKVDDENTSIYANFHEADPNEEMVEINVRRSCFYPKQTGIDYITVRGFEMAQAATPWAPPTADQPGLIGPNWSKGWIIEDNIIHDSKCSAISIGKEKSTGHNYRSIRKDKPGYQYQLESVFAAERIGWSKEKIGSHVIRNNTIYDCGQNAVVGHLGCIFSKIYNNHIYNIAIKREFYGHEIAGIKLHAPLDVHIYKNRIHDCSLGLWCDWQTQGTRISKNLLYNNSRDLFIEVSHGPYLIDNNIFASTTSLNNASQGGAYINNLFAGELINWKVLDRSTQYHLPHTTKIAGFALVYGGDDRFYNNLFIGKSKDEYVGTSHYNNNHTSIADFAFDIKLSEDVNEYSKREQPVYINNNAYLNHASPFVKEKSNLIEKEFNPNLKITDEGDNVYLECTMPDNYESLKGSTMSTDTLERVRIVDAEFENPDGSKLIINKDLLDNKYSNDAPIGPLCELKKGKNKIRVW